MNEMKDDPKAFDLPAASLRPELAARFLSAMQEASAEESTDGLEQRLRRLCPAPVEARRQRAWLAGMQAAGAGRSHRSAWRRMYRWGSAAALFVLCTAGAALLMDEAFSSDVPSSLACRSVIDAHEAEDVQWQDGQVAFRSCDVLYEDSFVLDGDEDCTITVRVPVRARVLLEEEVI